MLFARLFVLSSTSLVSLKKLVLIRLRGFLFRMHVFLWSVPIIMTFMLILKKSMLNPNPTLSMKHDQYNELLSLAGALTFISESDMLWSLVKADGDAVPDVNFSETLKYLLSKVASEIYSNLTA